ncbi:unnamed protein product [Caenorhabditis auriculariae]|uniref:N(4)-(beta-N-acetylglucosaminyl)-L-asparaginase n=1 Tax=Caenorhabditis auriculariae TaxID=2777116 RepID=A0A8S1GPG6_9PELO|nr:unnamed protein product [Caenorhabditis auriculariae]
MYVRRIVATAALVSACFGCLPNPFYGYSPGYGRVYTNPMVPPVVPPMVPPVPGYGYPGMVGPRVGPFRAEQRGGGAASASGAPQFSAQIDEMRSVSTLNCANFAEKCRWANTNEEELNWSTLQESPQATSFLQTLGVQNLPEQTAGVLVSTPRKGWEGGQLVSDPLPCIGNSLKVTATVWRSRLGPNSEQPKLQLCSKNTNEEKFPLVNCNEFEIRNGVPMSVDVPAPNTPNSPAQIVFYGNNFVAPEGGAIFLQDIVVEGSLQCNGEVYDSHPTLIADPFLKPSEKSSKKSYSDSIGPLKAMEGVSGLEAINAVPTAPDYDEGRISQFQTYSKGVVPALPPAPAQPPVLAPAIQQPVVQQQPQPASNSFAAQPTLFESCLSLSCNPSDLSCKFWRSAGNNRWGIAISGRVSNPLTGIQLPPGTAQKFLVAPFFDSHISSYTLVSEQITIPLMEEVYFCFYEYYATQGLSLSVCTDKMDCFYKKNSLTMGEAVEDNKKWNIRCAKMPPGNYEMRVIAENTGENKGEVGFLPIRLLLSFCGLVGCTPSYPLVVATWGGPSFQKAAAEAYENTLKVNRMYGLVRGLSRCEDLQCDGTVGYGGSPDESGETSLDALLIDASDMKVAAVANLHRVRNAAEVAWAVMNFTKHTFLVGESATQFALSMGFKERNLTTEASGKIHTDWLKNNCQPNFWKNVYPDPKTQCGPYKPLSPREVEKAGRFVENNSPVLLDEFNHDTIGIVVMDDDQQFSAGTSTNGMRFKIPGRVGDSPIPGSGAYAHKKHGAAVATGDGDIMMRFLPSFEAVQYMKHGNKPTKAAKKVINHMLTYFPDFQGAIVTVNRYGEHGAACSNFKKFMYTSVYKGVTNTHAVNCTIKAD